MLQLIHLLCGCAVTVDGERPNSEELLVADTTRELNGSHDEPKPTSSREVWLSRDSGVDSEIVVQGSESPTPQESRDCQPPLLFGHRGTTHGAPENTLEAFKWALDNGADGIELDVRRTRDAKLVVIHDGTIKRTTDSSDNVRVSDLTLQELKDLDAGAWFDPDFAGARIPSLSEVFKRFIDTPLLFMLDVKEVELAPQLAQLVEQVDLSDRIIFAASRLDILEGLYVQAPQVPALYFLDRIDEVDTIALPNIQYLRVPSDIEHDTTHALFVAERGFSVVTGASAMTWQTPSTALSVLAISNDVASACVTRENRRPADCTL